MTHNAPAKSREIKDKLKAIDEEMKKTKAEMDAMGAAIRKHRKREYYLKLVQAGKIIEEAGLLDSYDPDDLFALLVLNRNRLVRKV